SNEEVSFDENGVGGLSSEDLYNEVVNMPFFSPVIIEGPKELGEGVTTVLEVEGEVEVPDEPSDTDGGDGIPTLVHSEMTHAQLDGKAEELGVEVSGTK